MERRTNEGGRPDPDALLREVKKTERAQGRLKIFLGYSPGVGKTYSMLMEARVRHRRGDDIVIGVVETHGRSETAVLLEGLEVIPRTTGDYNGVRLEEMDLDAVLARRPEVVLVDELAHSNAPWSRHPKRYQDVAEILKAGIDVYTTLNVQHLESQRDVIARITGVEMREAVPDWVIDEADEVQTIDIPLETLFDRLREGKVYVPAEARRAMESFFQRGHLVALREIALNVVARKMDAELLDYRRARAINVPWPAAEKVMVCLAADAGASELVRKGYRIARERNAEWYVVHVAVPFLGELSAAHQVYLADALNLAERFGARTATLSEPDVVPAILRFARENNVSQIVVGRPERSLLTGALRGYPVYRLLREQSEFDIVLVSRILAAKRPGQPPRRRAFDARGYIAAVVVLAAATGLNLAIEHYANPISLYAVYLLATLVVALLFGLGASIWAAMLSFVAFDFLFIEPRLALSIKHPDDLVGAVVFLATSVAVGQLIAVARRQSAALRVRAERSSLLEELARDLLALPSRKTPPRSRDGRPGSAEDAALDGIAEIAIRYAAEAAAAPAVILFRTGQGRLEFWAHTAEGQPMTAEEMAVAEWAYAHGEEAGAGTETLPSTAFHFVPLSSEGEIVGVLGVRQSARLLLPEQRRVLRSIAGLAALSALHWVADPRDGRASA